MGEGGVGRGVAVLAAFVIVGIVMFATVDDARNGTSPTTDQTTSTAVGDEPCGGSSTVSAAVKSSSVGGLSGAANAYNVSDVRIASSDPTWGRFSTVPKAGQETNFQNGYGVIHCTSSGWTVTDFGTAQVGCSGSDAPPVPVRTELQLSCPS
jgi:hypothetical protein